MERSRVALITLMCVLISSISGIIVEMRVKPGDNATMYCDCESKSGFKIVWLRHSSHDHQNPLSYLTEAIILPRYSFVWNDTKRTFDLLVKNVSESDLGLYYCVLQKDKSGDAFYNDGHHYGSRSTFLSLHDTTVPCADLSQSNPSSFCWKLLVSVCPVCVLLSSVVSSTCVYCIYRNRTKGDCTTDQRENLKMNKHKVGDDGDVNYASLNIPNSGQRRLKIRTAESSDLCTYSEVKAEKVWTY